MAPATRPGKNRGPKLEPHQVMLQPLVTEKGTHQFTRHNAYPFQVNLWATKDQIRQAVEELFGVRVSKVRTQMRAREKAALKFPRRQDAELEKGDRHAARRGPNRILLTLSPTG